MATIANLKLEIKKGTGKSDVSVSYDLCFTKCEVMDGSTYNEFVTLRGDDSPLPDDHLKTLFRSCVSATKSCVKRSFKRKIKNSVLNEDDMIFNRGDEVYARVVIKPFKPSKRTVDSNIISSNF